MKPMALNDLYVKYIISVINRYNINKILWVWFNWWWCTDKKNVILKPKNKHPPPCLPWSFKDPCNNETYDVFVYPYFSKIMSTTITVTLNQRYVKYVIYVIDQKQREQINISTI